MPDVRTDAAGLAGAGVPIASQPERPAAVTDARERRRLGLGFWLPAAWLALVLFLAVAAPVLPLQDPLRTAPTASPGETPSAEHLLGTDNLGRDTLSRLVWGSRVALTVGLVAIGIGMAVGGTIGLLAGYFRGVTERLLMSVVDIMLAFPALVLAIAIVVFLGNSLRNVAIAVAIVSTPAFARITRAATLSFAQREFVTAARLMGARHRRIIVREILPNVIFPVVAFALVVVALAIVAEGGLAFLGLSVPLPRPSWGSMIVAGKNDLDRFPLVSLTPAFVMFLTVLSFNLLGDKFRELFNVQEAKL